MRYIIFYLCFGFLLVSCSNEKRAGSVYNQPQYSQIIDSNNLIGGVGSGVIPPSEVKKFFALPDGDNNVLNGKSITVMDKYYAASGDFCRRFQDSATLEKKILCVKSDDKELKNAFVKQALR